MEPSRTFHAVEKIFLSYTYRPHPDHATDLERLRRCVVRAVEAMGLRIVDGVDVGGRDLDEALKARIESADALIALQTPQSDLAGNIVSPDFVVSEFQYAEGRRKPTFRVLHEQLKVRGLGSGNEHAAYAPGKELDVILKLMNTIAVWRQEYGRDARVRIEPQDLAVRYDEMQGDRCEFQLISATGQFRDFERANLQLAPGAAYVRLPGIRNGDTVRLRVTQDGRRWQSRDAIDPFVGGVRLEERT